MSFLQLTGLSGAGKSTLAEAVKMQLGQEGVRVDIIDGDIYRKTLCSDLGFSRADRQENIRRLAKVANEFSQTGSMAILAAINPFKEIRAELLHQYNAPVVWIHCELSILQQRDTKGLYARAALPDDHPQKLSNLTGVNDVYEKPVDPALIIDTGKNNVEVSKQHLLQFIETHFIQSRV